MSQSPVRLLSSMSRLPEAELTRRIAELKDPSTGKVKALSTLDAALVQSAGGMKQSTLAAYDSLSTRAQTSHVIEEPAQAFTRTQSQAGYAEGPVEKPSPQLKNVLDAAGKAGAKRAQSAAQQWSAFDGPSASDLARTGGQVDADSRQMLFEQLKNEMNKITQTTQMITNTLNAMHEQAMTAIRNSKA